MTIKVVWPLISAKSVRERDMSLPDRDSLLERFAIFLGQFQVEVWAEEKKMNRILSDNERRAEIVARVRRALEKHFDYQYSDKEFNSLLKDLERVLDDSEESESAHAMRAERRKTEAKWAAMAGSKWGPVGCCVIGFVGVMAFLVFSVCNTWVREQRKAEALSAENTAAADALKALAGEWVVLESETFGRQGELHVGDAFKFEGDRLTHEPGGKPLEYRLRVNPKSEPRQLDWRPAEPGDVKWSHRGIYRIVGDKLTLCVLSRFEANDEKDRPSEFRTKAGREKGETAGDMLLVLKRKGR